MRAAGIFSAVAAGNSGPDCSTIVDPPAIYEASVTVGATDQLNRIANFSSRGPVTIDVSNRLKPDLAAPGVKIRGAAPGGGYGWSNGTSMATPHVAAAVALVWQAKPGLIGEVDATAALLTAFAAPKTLRGECEGISGRISQTMPSATVCWTSWRPCRRRKLHPAIHGLSGM